MWKASSIPSVAKMISRGFLFFYNTYLSKHDVKAPFLWYVLTAGKDPTINKMSSLSPQKLISGKFMLYFSLGL